MKPVTPLPMSEQQATWCKDNLYFLTHGTTPTLEQKLRLYAIYNALYLDTKKPGGCARCLTTVKQYVYASFVRYENNLK